MTYDIRGTEPLPEFKDEEQVIEFEICAECGYHIHEGFKVDDRANGFTFFCHEHLPNCKVGQQLWVDQWFKRYVSMSPLQRYNLIIQKF